MKRCRARSFRRAAASYGPTGRDRRRSTAFPPQSFFHGGLSGRTVAATLTAPVPPQEWSESRPAHSLSSRDDAMTIVSDRMDDAERLREDDERRREAGGFSFRSVELLLPKSIVEQQYASGTVRERVAVLLLTATLATFPIWFVRVPVLGVTLPVPGVLLIAAAIAAMLQKGSLNAAMRTLMAAPLFWLATVCYLLYFALLAVTLEAATPPAFFLKRLVLVGCTFTVAMQCGRLSDSGRLRRVLARAIWPAIFATLAAVWYGLKTSGLSLSLLGEMLLDDDLSPYRSQLGTVLTAVSPRMESPIEAEVTIERLRVRFGLMWAVLAIGSLLTAEPRHRGVMWLTGSFVAIALAVVSTALTAAISLGVAICWLVWVWLRKSSQRMLNVAAIVGMFLVVGILAVALDPQTSTDFVRDRARVPTELETAELDAATEAAESQPISRLIFGIGPDGVHQRRRFQNLLFSSFIEGGLIGLSFVLLQFVSLLAAAAVVVSRGSILGVVSPEVADRRRFAAAAASLLMVALAPTMASTGGGFYAAPGLLAIALFLGAATPVLVPAGQRMTTGPTAATVSQLLTQLGRRPSGSGEST